MPQMKPMVWLMMMILTLMMIFATIVINFFSSMDSFNKPNSKKIKLIKWKW